MPAFAVDVTSSHNNTVMDANFYDDANCFVDNGIVYFQRNQLIGQSGNIKNYQVDTVSLIPAEGKSSSDIINVFNEYKATKNTNTRASSTIGSIWDSSVSVQTNCTITYSSYEDSAGVGFAKLTGFSGNYTIHDNHVRVDRLYVEYGSTGLGVGAYYNQYDDMFISSSSWSYSAPSSWQYVTTDNASYFIGTTYTFSISHMGGSTWTSTVQNNL